MLEYQCMTVEGSNSVQVI